MTTLLSAGTALITNSAPDDGLLDRPDLVWYWSDETETVMGFGAAAIIGVPTGIGRLARLDDIVATTLASITVDDRRRRVTSQVLPRALGAIPFDRHTPGTMVIPEVTVGTTRNGDTWRCEIVFDSSAQDRSASLEGSELWWSTDDRVAVDQTAWESMVRTAQERLHATPLEKVVLARTSSQVMAAPPTRSAVIRALIDGNPGAYVFCAGNFVGATPELLVERTGRLARCRPMAGTSWPAPDADRPATSDEPTDSDARQADDSAPLDNGAMTPKDRHEHTVMVGPLLDRLRGVAVRVDATDPVEVDAGPLRHLATTVVAELPQDDPPRALGLVAALHPTGAVAGHPRDLALAAIAELEPDGRGPYAGPVGWMDSSGDGRFAVAVRSALLGSDRVVCFAGAGIVDESDPTREWVETEQKLQIMRTALDTSAGDT